MLRLQRSSWHLSGSNMKCQDSKQKMLQAQHFSTSNMADEVQNDNFCLNVYISIHLEIIVTSTSGMRIHIYFFEDFLVRRFMLKSSSNFFQL